MVSQDTNELLHILAGLCTSLNDRGVLDVEGLRKYIEHAVISRRNDRDADSPTLEYFIDFLKRMAAKNRQVNVASESAKGGRS